MTRNEALAKARALWAALSPNSPADASDELIEFKFTHGLTWPEIAGEPVNAEGEIERTER